MKENLQFSCSSSSWWLWLMRVCVIISFSLVFPEIKEVRILCVCPSWPLWSSPLDFWWSYPLPSLSSSGALELSSSSSSMNWYSIREERRGGTRDHLIFKMIIMMLMWGADVQSFSRHRMKKRKKCESCVSLSYFSLYISSWRFFRRREEELKRIYFP